MFTKEERSTFPYWFAHWCAFNMTALNLRAWKFKYLFHDIEKPWLRLFWDYEKVQRWHRHHNNHHLEYLLRGTVDVEAMLIDWECSRFTKEASTLTARQEWEKIVEEWKAYDQQLYHRLMLRHPELTTVDETLEKLGL